MNNKSGYIKPVNWHDYILIVLLILIFIGYSIYHFTCYHYKTEEVIFFSAYLLLNVYLIVIFRRYNKARLIDIAALEQITRTLADEINERERIEEALTESELRYRNIFENTSNAVAVYDAVDNGNNFIFKQFNKAGEQIDRINRKDLIGRYITDVFPGAEKFGILEVFKRVWKTGEAEEFPLKFYQDDRLSGWRNNYIYRLPNGEIVTVYTDETERMLAQAERENLIKELEMKNKEMEQFTYMVSHDLKSPLISIKGFAGLLKKDLKRNDEVNIKKDIDNINNAAQKMHELLNELLELSRRGKLVNTPGKVSFKSLAEEAIESVAGQMNNINARINISNDLPDIIADGSRIRQMLMNLLDNAIKYTDKENPVIEIGFNRKDNEAVFYVRDNGPGIYPEYHEKIFGLFDKLDSNKEGSGAGLAIVKRIVEAHGGRVWVESEGSRNGSTFYFTLPVYETGYGKDK